MIETALKFKASTIERLANGIPQGKSVTWRAQDYGTFSGRIKSAEAIVDEVSTSYP